MKFNILLMVTALAGVHAMPTEVEELSIRSCDCVHNNDAARWDDALKPSERLADLCSNGGGCYKAAKGTMCVTGDLSKCSCASDSAAQWQSFHGNWFLWSAITCGGLSVTIT